MAIIQLSTDVDALVFVVDVVAFLEAGADSGSGDSGGRGRLVEILGSLFRNPKILKLGNASHLYWTLTQKVKGNGY